MVLVYQIEIRSGIGYRIPTRIPKLLCKALNKGVESIKYTGVL